jgi:hypothetical protein
MSLLVFILFSYGLTQILTVGRIFNPIRPKTKFFHCPMCIGFHVGWIIILLNHFLGINIFTNVIGYDLFIGGCISSGTSYWLQSSINDDGIQIGERK